MLGDTWRLGGKESTCRGRRLRFDPGGGNNNAPQYSCLGNPTDKGAWRATVHGVAMSQAQLSTLAYAA